MGSDGVKKRISSEFPYYKTNVLQYTLDVMHIKKNLFENIFNTVMDVKKKPKDNIKARMDIAFFFCDRQNMELLNDEVHIAKPKMGFN